MKSVSQKIIFGNFGKKKPPIKPTNENSGRPREHLTRDEFLKLRATLKKGNNAERNELLLLLAGQHGLRVSELLGLRWVDVDVKAKIISIRRLKNGISGEHPLYREETRLISRLKRKEQPCDQDYIFKGYNNTAMTPNAVYKIIQKAGIDAGIPFPIHPHMCRHSTGYALVNKGVPLVNIQQYMGHRQVSSTIIYTALDNTRFRKFDAIFS